MPRQFVQVALKPGGKLYTYINDEPDDVQVGHSVEITTPWGTPLITEVQAVGAVQPPDIPETVELKQARKV